MTLRPFIYWTMSFSRKTLQVILENCSEQILTSLTPDRKKVLQTIYLFNTYSLDQYPNANKIGNMIWTQEGKANVLEGFEAFKRKIRLSVNAMEKRKIIIVIDRHQNRPKYALNSNFNRTPSIFDEF